MNLREALFPPPPFQPDAALPITAYSHGLIISKRTGTWTATLSDPRLLIYNSHQWKVF